MDATGQLSAALLGRYTVDQEIGRGGMATVYLARDVRHNRKVALKVLNPDLGAVLGVERFLAEIQVTANLQHPNLLPLFDSGEANGLLFYVMPFVEGESLRAMLQREKQLGVEESIHIATAVAAALDYAHRHGVIHRDLKPENILMHDGQPVVADFGIALAVSNAGRGRITQSGVSLGTPHYMSPEQATGDREIDGRTDLYSLGAVTYEMLTGEPPHDGKTSQAIIAKVLTDRPRGIRLARESVPVHVEAAVMRALAKVPADRFHTGHEFADALQGKLTAPITVMATVAAEPNARRRPTTWKELAPWAVTIAAVVVAGIVWRTSRTGLAGERTLRSEISLPPDVDVTSPREATVAIAPGGRYVAYVGSDSDGKRRIFLRSDDDLEPRPVAGSEGALSPSFSPDGSTILFVSDSALRKVSVNGGKVETITDEGVDLFRGWSWAPSGWIVASTGRGLVKIPAAGGKPIPVTTSDAAHGETGQVHPVALADGKTILYSSGRMGGASYAHIGVATIDGTSNSLDLVGSYPLGVVDGFLIYSNAAGTLMAVPFDVARRSITGSPMALVDQAAVSSAFGITDAQMSIDGSIVYLPGALRRQAVLRNPDGTVRLIGPRGPFSMPRFSPDGQRIALSVGTLTQRDISLMQVPAGNLTRLTYGTEINDRPEWKSDGSAVIFRSTRGAKHAIWTVPASGGASSVLFRRSDAHIDEGVLSPDGRHLIVQRDTIGNGETWVADLDGSGGFTRVAAGVGVYGGRFSPDGKWVVFTSTLVQGGGSEIMIAPFPGLTSFRQVSRNGGETPIWSADGKRIYYVSGRQLIAATIGSTAPLTIKSRKVVLDRGYSFQNVHADYDVARDETIVAFQSPDTRLVVIRNIGAELRARVRAATR